MSDDPDVVGVWSPIWPPAQIRTQPRQVRIGIQHRRDGRGATASLQQRHCMPACAPSTGIKPTPVASQFLRYPILKWDGATFTPQSSGTTQQLLGLWGMDANNVRAVGTSGTLLRWDGVKWSREVSGTTAHLGSLWGSGSGDIWAAGTGGTLRRWNGLSWVTADTGVQRTLTRIFGGDPRSLQIVGQGGTLLLGRR